MFKKVRIVFGACEFKIYSNNTIIMSVDHTINHEVYIIK